MHAGAGCATRGCPAARVCSSAEQPAADATVIAASSWLIGSTYDSGGWRLRGTGDVDGDGKDDLLWHSSSQSRFVYWIMDGARVTTRQVFNVHPGYGVLATGDFDGNGRVDVLWGNASRTLYAWLGNGSTFTSTAAGTYSAGGWKPVNWKGVTGAD